MDGANHEATPLHNDEVETVTLYRGLASIRSSHQVYEHNHNDDQCDCARDTTKGAGTDSRSLPGDSNEPIQRDILESALHELPKESIWRVKGFVHLKNQETPSELSKSQIYILNWAFGRYDLTPFLSESGLEELGVIKLTVMGERGEVRRAIRRFSMSLSAQIL